MPRRARLGGRRRRQPRARGRHYSWAIHDAAELFTVPVVEVHLSNIDEREEWRRFSVLEGLVAARIIGKGPEGYREALEFLVQEGP